MLLIMLERILDWYINSYNYSKLYELYYIRYIDKLKINKPMFFFSRYNYIGYLSIFV